MASDAEQGTPRSDDGTLRRAAEAARAHAAAADAVATLVERMASPPDAAELVEYASLLSRETYTLRERSAALQASGLAVDSFDEDDDTSDTE
jgi:hypothetical protein